MIIFIRLTYLYLRCGYCLSTACRQALLKSHPAIHHQK